MHRFMREWRFKSASIVDLTLLNKTGNVHIIVSSRSVRLTNVAVEKQ